MANLLGIIDLPIALDIPLTEHMKVQAKSSAGAMVPHWVDAKVSA